MKLVLAALCILTGTAAYAENLDGKAVPLFPNLTWGLQKDAALSKGLQAYNDDGTGQRVVGLPAAKVGEITFALQAEFAKKDVGAVPSGLNYIVLQHEGQVPKTAYEKFVRHITKGFLYAGQASHLNDAAAFYNAVDKQSSLIVRTTTNRGKTYLVVAIAPGTSK